MNQTPESGPSILFFSGGTALKDTSKALTRHTHNAIHLVTPFDSGGSSAVLRKAFDMPAVGDIRNRLMALADRSVKGSSEIFKLFSYRLAHDTSHAHLLTQITGLVMGYHPYISHIPEPAQGVIRDHLRTFLEHMDESFDLEGASVGNLVLAGGYLAGERSLDKVIDTIARLIRARGMVRPVVEDDLHLATRLANGRTINGQHLLTGKESQAITSPVEEIWLTRSLVDPAPVKASVRDSILKLISNADLICFPIGSFYSSIVANLLPSGVARAVKNNPCPKIFVPNTIPDPELLGHTLVNQVDMIIDTLDSGTKKTDGTGLDMILVDSANTDYPGGIDMKGLEQRGLVVMDTTLIVPDDGPHINANLLADTLFGLTRS